MRYFTIEELCKSNKARELGIENIPSSSIIENMKEMVDNILDPIRQAWGAPIKVNSGYRCPKLNDAVRGSKTSVHMKGYAADIRPLTSNLQYFIIWLQKFLANNPNLHFDQLIKESGCVHIGYKSNSGQQRHKFMDLSNIY